MKTLLAIVLLCCSLSAQWSINTVWLGGGCPLESNTGGVIISDVGGATVTSWIDYDVDAVRIVVVGVDEGYASTPLLPPDCVMRVNLGLMTTVAMPVGVAHVRLLTLPWWSTFGPFVIQDIYLGMVPRLSDGWRVTILPS